MNRILATLLILASSSVLAGPGGLLDGSRGMETKPSRYSVAETMNRVEAEAKSIGAHIFNRIDYREMSSKVGVDVRPNQLLIFGRGKGGPYLIKEASVAAIDLPFKALAWEDGQGKVWLTYTTGTYIDGRYAVKGAAEYVKNIDETIGKIMAEALK